MAIPLSSTVALALNCHALCMRCAGNGLVVYAGERVGLVLVDRNTVAVGPCDVSLSFGAYPAEISGRVRFLHPLHNFALVSYDPAALPPEARAKVRTLQLARDVWMSVDVVISDECHLGVLPLFPEGVAD